MNQHADKRIPYPWRQEVYDGADDKRISYDPLGSYTGRPLEPGEIPVQDADDL